MKNNNWESLNLYSKKRGPDLTVFTQINGFHFLQNLLSITGEFTPQPFFSDSGSIAALYNGEIYNAKEIVKIPLASDGLCIIPAYQKYGVSFSQQMDGEFAIVLIDFDEGIIVIATDPFATKPLWYANDRGSFAAASYKSNLLLMGFPDHLIQKSRPNSTLVFDLYSLELVGKETNCEFDIHNQSKDSFNDWIDSFEQAVIKRTVGVREKVFIGLSSGYDSGALACAMQKHDIPFKAYSIFAREDRDKLVARHKLLKDGCLVDLSSRQYEEARAYLIKNCEPLQYEIFRDGVLTPEEFMHDDQGAIGLAHICSLAKEDGNKIYLSGQGADEILSDYGFKGEKKYNHSNFGGEFPKDLTLIFPWRSFYASTQASYLGKEEYVSGSFGLEGRYPFLDKALVQEFLWLSPELKNSHYKSPLHHYLTINDYPFNINEKIGFSSGYKLDV